MVSCWQMTIYTLYFDGSCGPVNPGGTAAYGFTLSRNGENLEEGHAVVGCGPKMSNNYAEFAGLAAGLKAVESQLIPGHGRAVLNVFGDSQIVINIMSKRWRANPDKLYYPAWEEAFEVLRRLRQAGVTVFFDHIPREMNTECDRLSKVHTDKVS
jgi:ribonuclease HI